MMFAFSMQLLTVAPLYIMFGDQRIDKDKMEICTLKNARACHDAGSHEEKEFMKEGDWGLNLESGFGCQMSMISQLYHKMELGLPAFAILNYFLHWAFIAFFCIFLAYHAHYKQTYLQQNMSSEYSQLNATDGDDQDEDLNLFLKSTLKKDNANLDQHMKQDRM